MHVAGYTKTIANKIELRSKIVPLLHHRVVRVILRVVHTRVLRVYFLSPPQAKAHPSSKEDQPAPLRNRIDDDLGDL